MNYRKGLRALGLSFIAVLGLMAFMAAGAQAKWLVLLKAAPGVVHDGAGEALEVKTHEAGKLLVPGQNLEVVCENVAGKELALEGETLAKGSVVFTGCQTYSTAGGGLKSAANCAPEEPIVAGGSAHLVLHTASGTGTKNYVEFRPPTGKPFTTLVFSELCALTETNEVTGKLLAECGHLNESKQFVLLDCSAHEPTHLLREAVSKLGQKLSFGEQSATLDGIAAVSLAGKYTGESWGGHV